MKITAILAWALPAIIAATGIACDCNAKPPPRKALEKAATVFMGRVVMGRVVKRRLDKEAEMREMREFLFEVSGVWKGPASKRIFVLTRMDSAACGFDFELGESYLVYAYGDATQFVTNICTRTCHQGMASDDLSQLGASTKP